MSGLLFVLSGPSGVGKSTIRKEVMKICQGLRYSVSCTTRSPRANEVEGVDYYFVDLATFEAMRDQGEFVEWAKVHGNYYGTPRRPLEAWWQEGFDVILEIDVQGAKQVKAVFPQGIFVFIAPPSLRILEERLRGRHSDLEDDILLRMTNAHLEMQSIRDYNYLVVNDVLEKAVDQFRAIIVAERCRIRE
ncbi:MAG: guanylate kinase [Candidatus Atribacteria bacterium]|nr:guanylate kinase [Candidatus Atribacteria bacterium]